MRHLLGAIILVLAATGWAADTDDLRERLDLARRLAREADDRTLIARAEAALRARPADPAEVAALEAALGIDPGGWSVGGLPLFRPRPGDAAALAGVEVRLQAGLAARDPLLVAAAVSDWCGVLGERAGLPDARRPGWRPAADASTAAPAAAYLLARLADASPMLDDLAAGRARGGVMMRSYAGMLDALCTLRPVAPASALPRLDRLIDGAAGILLAMQRPEGHWPFPDLRGRHLRFGDMIGREVAAGARVEYGWLIDPGPRGESNFDTGLAGQALLRAARLRGMAAWREAGARAARWVAPRPLSTNWNYNAFAMALCADAAQASGDAGLQEAAYAIAMAGVLPGQLADGAQRGRWLDPHNARTVYHRIILRCLHDVLEALPSGDPRRQAIAAAARLAVTALADEHAAVGVSVICLRELSRHADLVADPDLRLAAMLDDHRRTAAARHAGAAAPGADPAELARWVVDR
jgi:hypothetical protein